MAEGVATIDLRALGLAPGAAVHLRVAVPPIDLRIAGQDYLTDPASPEVDIDVSRSHSGLHLRLRMEADLVGPCWSCVEDARVPVAAFGEIGLTGELRSVAHHDRRSEEARKFGLTQLVTPETAPTLRDAVRLAFGSARSSSRRAA